MMGAEQTLTLHFFLFCQPENDKKQQEPTLKKWHLLAFLAFLVVEVRKSAKLVPENGDGSMEWSARRLTFTVSSQRFL
jgi:hypothetical protein